MSMQMTPCNMKSIVIPSPGDETMKYGLGQAMNAFPDYEFDFSIDSDGSFFEWEPDQSVRPVHDLPDLPDAKRMRVACASGDLAAVQSVFEMYWLDRPASERLSKGVFGASGLCEAIKRDDIFIGS